MVHTIGPMGHGAAVPHSRARWAGFHILGGALGGAAVTGVLAAAAHAGSIPVRVGASLVFVVCAVALVADIGLFNFRIPSSGRQVPASWRRRLRPSLCAFAYGVGLGAAFGTRIRFAITYVVILGSAVLLSIDRAVIVGALFGLSRASVVLVAVGANDRAVLTRRLSTLDRRLKMVQLATIFSTGLVAAIALRAF